MSLPSNYSESAAARRGLARIEIVVLLGLALMVGAVTLPSCSGARNTAQGNVCRNNMSNLAKALFMYANRNNGRYPGYMNVFSAKNSDGKEIAYRDPKTMMITPVSWAVMILPDIDRAAQLEAWRKTTLSEDANEQMQLQSLTHVYVPLFLCPAENTSGQGTPIGYVVNTGMEDFVASIPAQAGGGGSGAGGTGGSGGSVRPAGAGMPRDWASNGMFFDNYSDHELIKTSATARGPMVVMRHEMVRDPKDKTILLTENTDAGNYTFDSTGPGGQMFTNAEVEVGCIYAPGPVQNSQGMPPSMMPRRLNRDAPSLLINGNPGKGDQISYDYCRPSSYHPGGVNVAFVGQNVQFLREEVSYFVLAKLMASEDSQMKIPGTQTFADPILRQYQLRDVDINP